jgi:hypothetical protein
MKIFITRFFLFSARHFPLFSHLTKIKMIERLFFFLNNDLSFSYFLLPKKKEIPY